MVVVRNARKSGAETEFGLRLTAIFRLRFQSSKFRFQIPDFRFSGHDTYRPLRRRAGGAACRSDPWPDSAAAGRRARAGVQAADDPRVQPEIAAGHAAASRAAREVPSRRHPQPPADADLARRVRPGDERDGGEQPPNPRQPERLVRRSAAPRRRRLEGQQVQGPHGPVREHQLRRLCRSRLRREGRQTAGR